MSHMQSFHSGFHADQNLSRSEWSLDINFIKKCEWCHHGCSGGCQDVAIVFTWIIVISVQLQGCS